MEQNNQQAMQRNSNNLGNRMQSMDIARGGMGLVGGANDMTSNNYQNYMTAAQMPQQYDWNNLNNYANLMYQGAALGGTNKGTQGSQPGIIPSILGTGMGIAGIGRGMGLFGG